MPHLPELPGRGAGADMVGRTAALLVDLAVDITPAGWRLVPRGGHRPAAGRGVPRPRPGRAARRGRGLRRTAEAAGRGAVDAGRLAGAHPRRAGRRRRRGAPRPGAVADRGAGRARGRGRRAGAGRALVVQLDEPSVPAVLQGGLPTATGFGRLSAVPAEDVERELRRRRRGPAGAGGRALLRPADAADAVPVRRRRGAVVRPVAGAGPRRRGRGRRRRRPPAGRCGRRAPMRAAGREGDRLRACRAGGASSASPPSSCPRSSPSRRPAAWPAPRPATRGRAMTHLREAAKYLQPE